MNRFEVYGMPERIIDNVTGKIYYPESDEILELLNELNDRADKVIELFTTEELLKLKWQKDIYQRFSNEVMEILEKHEIDSLMKLDQVLFNQRKW